MRSLVDHENGNIGLHSGLEKSCSAISAMGEWLTIVE